VEAVGLLCDHLSYILQFGKFCGHLVYFMVISYIFSSLDILCQEKSGKTDLNTRKLANMYIYANGCSYDS
jgi:hypothetical protein